MVNEKMEQLKQDQTVFRDIIGGVPCGLLILNRGEQMFYQENDQALICEIQARHRIVYTKTIKKWDNGKKISEEEKDNILNRIKLLYKKAYKEDITFE